MPTPRSHVVSSHCALGAGYWRCRPHTPARHEYRAHQLEKLPWLSEGLSCRGVAAVTLLRSTLACNLLRMFATTRRYSNNRDKIEQRKFSSCTGISGYLESSVESVKCREYIRSRMLRSAGELNKDMILEKRLMD